MDDNASYIGVLEAAGSSFQGSTSGASIIADMKSNLTARGYTGPNYVEQIMKSPQFSGVDFTSLPNTITISAAITAQGSYGVGLSGSLGLAFDPINLDLATVESGGMTVGLEIGADVGFQLGIWMVAPSELAGLCFGGMFGIDIEEGFTVGVYFGLDGSLLGFTVDVDLGLEAQSAAYVGYSGVQMVTD